MSETQQADGWTVIDHDNDNRKVFDARSEAEDAAETAREFGSENVDVLAPGDGADDSSDEKAPTPVAEAPADETGAVPLGGEMNIDSDPLEVLPGWMVTQVSYNDRGDSSTTINKRGCQVIAEYLGLDMVAREAIQRAHETDFEFATYEVTMAKPDGRRFTGVGTARADESDQGEGAGWKLDMMAETRAYKRAVKSATGGGIEAFAKEQGGRHE
jgi:hypothetical protein